jgi:vacuolar protein sorting-associated protein 35
MLKAEDEHAQSRWLEAAKKIVKEQAFYMKRAMDGDKLDLALDHAMEMLRELKTNLLSPKSYYELYMKVQEELRELEDFLSSLQRNGRSMSGIYEQVQNCVHVVPRLYLVCCVGGVFITSQEAAAKDILTDMVEIIKGVQHPMRGLFLRNYLTQVTKNRLPDAGSVFEGAGGSVQDAYLFVLQNFTEANRLWVRLQTQGAPKDRKKREKERLDLRILVGTNLVRLSQLEGLDVYEYETNVLPKILEEVISCKDTIAQSYLMDCIIQVFPDDFHLATLEPFLKACVQLKDKVNVRTILESMIDRLTTSFTTATTDELGSTSNAFKLFNDCVNSINENRTNIKLIDSLRLQTLLVTFALKCFPKNIEYVSHCLEQSSAIVTKAGFIAQCAANRDQEAASIGETVSQIESLLLSPLSVLAMRVLEIPAYTTLMALLPWDNWKGVSSALLQAVITIKTPISTPDELEKLLSSVTPLLKDEPGVAPSVDEDGRDLPATQAFTDEQQLVAKMTHLIKSPDTDTTIRMLIVARTHFAAGGSQRLQHTLTPLVFSALSVVRRVLGRESAAIAAAALTLSAAGEGGEKAQTDPPVEAVVVPLAFSSRKVTDDFISLLCSVTVACYVYTSLICYEDHHRVV